MRKTNRLPILAIIIIITFIGYKAFTHLQVKELSTHQERIIQKPVDNNSVIIPENILQKTAKLKHKEQQIIDAKNHEFSPDPKIESAIIRTKYSPCVQYFYAKNFLTTPIYTRFKKKIQRDYYIKATENCEKLNEQHPEYNLNKSHNQLNAILKIKGTTRFGILIEYSKQPYTTEDSLYVFTTVGQYFPELINSPALYKTLQYQIDFTIPDLQEILQTTDVNYVSTIMHNAQSYLACELGVNCQANSNVMFYYCRSEVNFCVKDYMTLFNTRFSEGMQADILLALPYFEKLYGVEISP